MPIEEYSSQRRCQPNIQCPKCSSIDNENYLKQIEELEEHFKFSWLNESDVIWRSLHVKTKEDFIKWSANLECNEAIDQYLVTYMKTTLVNSLLGDIKKVQTYLKMYVDVLDTQHGGTPLDTNNTVFKSCFITSIVVNVLFVVFFVTKLVSVCKAKNNDAHANNSSKTTVTTASRSAENVQNHQSESEYLYCEPKILRLDSTNDSATYANSSAHANASNYFN